jgi:hypothetical protein
MPEPIAFEVDMATEMLKEKNHQVLIKPIRSDSSRTQENLLTHP